LSGSLVITDGQAPTVPPLTLNTASPYGSFYKGNITLGYTFSEQMSTGSYLEISPTGGNTDALSIRKIGLTNVANNTPGSHTLVVDLNSSTLALVSGTTYSFRLVVEDLAGHGVLSNYVDNVIYDAVGPSAPNIPNLILFGITNPLLSWLASSDNFGNGSGVKQYVLRVFTGNNTCSTAGTTYTLSGNVLNYQLVGLVTNSYSWSIYGVDNMNNTGTLSTCDDFVVDTAIPTIISPQITNTNTSSTHYAKNGNVLQIKATIPNSSAAHIWANLVSLTGQGSDGSVSCAAPTAGVSCTYSANQVTYTLTAAAAADGVRSVGLVAQNAVGANEQTSSTSITIDNTSPQISGGITSPVG